ncbi:MAG: von Willebrand factor type A domain-containing protein [Coriobacteriales bacterium]|jgi:Ca-activated chloride channel family protein|nr:von Willebrand factor type A domain-containing protein [Coriobacteriales bacterium]
MSRIPKVIISVSLAATLALAGTGCTEPPTGEVYPPVGTQPTESREFIAFTGKIPQPAEQAQFVALTGTELPDTPLSKEDAPAPKTFTHKQITAFKELEAQALNDGRALLNATDNDVPPVAATPPVVTLESPAPQYSIEPESTAPTPGAPSSDSSAPGTFSAPSSSSETSASVDGPYSEYLDPLPSNTEEYNVIDQYGYRSVFTNPTSTFSADVDTASYANLRRLINSGYALSDIPSGAVRVEEMLNYFNYSFIAPSEGEPFSLNAQIADCPWNPDTRLMVVGIQAQLPDVTSAQGSNLVFLIDTSGSMYSEDKLPLLKQSFSLLTEQLTEADTVSIVTYAGNVSIALEGARGNQTDRILGSLELLEAGGSTNGASGLALAYALAQEHFIEGGNNRIIMASDGDLNVGISSQSDLHDYVSYKRQTGVYLSVLGFGSGNFKDNKMETLADDGNGNYHYIDSIEEAQKVFGEDLTANLITVADDVKLQLEFNPAYIKGYRQIGYENRALEHADFTDDTKDAAEMGAGHQVIVVYEIVMADSALDVGGEDLAYQGNTQPNAANGTEGSTVGVPNGEWLKLSLRYKDPASPVSKGSSYTLDESAYTSEPDADWVFVSGVVEAALVITQSDYAGSSTLGEAVARVDAGAADDARRQELALLINKLSL